MNESTPPFPNPGAFGGTTPPVIFTAQPGRSSGTDPDEKTPIQGVIGAVEAILRQPRRVIYQLRQQRPGRLIGSLLLIAVFSSLIYGLVVGRFSGGQQYWAAPVKIAGGLLISALICLPSLYIFSCLGGSQAKLAEVWGLVAGLLALMTILLAGFAPVAWVFSESTTYLPLMGSLHLLFWLVATIFGLRFLKSGFCRVNARPDSGFRVWVIIFLLVSLQMTTALRPILGKSDRFLPSAADKQFFVMHWIESFDSQAQNWPQGSRKTK